MKIRSIRATNIKVPEIDVSLEPGKVLAIEGPNQSGKSAVVDALLIGLFGYHPQAGKTAKATAQFLRGDAKSASITIETAAGTFSRKLTRTPAGSVKIDSVVPDVELAPEPWLFSAEAFTTATEKARLKMLSDALGNAGGLRSWSEIERALREADAISDDVGLSDDIEFDEVPTVAAIDAEIVAAKEALKVQSGVSATARASKKGLAYVEAAADTGDFDAESKRLALLTELIDANNRAIAKAQAVSEAGDSLRGMVFPDPRAIDAELGRLRAERTRLSDLWRRLKSRQETIATTEKIQRDALIDLEKLSQSASKVEAEIQALDSAAGVSDEDKSILQALITIRGVADLVPLTAGCPCCNAPEWDREAFEARIHEIRTKLNDGETARAHRLKLESIKRRIQEREDDIAIARKQGEAMAKDGTIDLEEIGREMERISSLGKDLAAGIATLEAGAQAIKVAVANDMAPEAPFTGAAKAELVSLLNARGQMLKEQAEARAKVESFRDEESRRRTWRDLDAMEREAESRIPTLKAMIEGLEAIRNDVLVTVLSPLVERARNVWPLDGEIDVIGSEFVVKRDGLIVTWSAMSGAERLAVSTAIKLALSESRILIVDEMGIFDDAARERFAARLEALASAGEADTIITLSPRA